MKHTFLFTFNKKNNVLRFEINVCLISENLCWSLLVRIQKYQISFDTHHLLFG